MKEVVAEFKERISIKVKRQDMIKKQDFRREKLLEKYMMKIYKQDNRKFEKVGKKLLKIEVSFSRG